MNDQNISIFKERLENMKSIWTEITFVRFFLFSNATTEEAASFESGKIISSFLTPAKKNGVLVLSLSVH